MVRWSQSTLLVWYPPRTSIPGFGSGRWAAFASLSQAPLQGWWAQGALLPTDLGGEQAEHVYASHGLQNHKLGLAGRAKHCLLGASARDHLASPGKSKKTSLLVPSLGRMELQVPPNPP